MGTKNEGKKGGASNSYNRKKVSEGQGKNLVYSEKQGKEREEGSAPTKKRKKT